MGKINFVIYSLGGNDTAIVIGEYKNKKEINDKIMKEYKNVEQVGFVSTNKYKLDMAGGEFCGNACRAAATYYLNGKNGNLKLETVAGTIECGIVNGETWVQIPTPKPKKIANGIFLVEMNGITHIVIDKKECNVGAVGVIPYDNGSINPFVWVKDINTFFNETGCLSGTVATASVVKTNSVKQPSGSNYKVEYGKKIKVSGEVKLLEKKSI